MDKLPSCYRNQNREDMFREGLSTGKAAYEDGLTYSHTIFETQTPRYVLSNASPYGLTTLLFMPAIRLLGTEEQKRRYLPLAEDGRIVGAYVQTELGHGTFVRGCETTATYDGKEDVFVMNSPTLRGVKSWPGALAHSCTHAVVMARLVVGGRDHGLHAFVVQVRSVEDFVPLPGVELGDMGLKMGYNTIDNGYAKFDGVKIRRSDMLSRYARVEKAPDAPDGAVYVKAKHPKAMYAGMVYVRGIVIRISGFQLAQAVTIAVRYSVVREQSMPADGDEKEHGKTQEAQIIYHKQQHFRLLTNIAKAFTILFATRHCDAKLEDHFRRIDKEDFSTAQEAHIPTAGFKAWCTQTAADGAEDCRKSCGGHGYLMISGLPDIVNTCVAMCTFEGENFVLWLQVWRYLASCVKKIEKEQVVGEDVKYLQESRKEYVVWADHAKDQGCLPRCVAQGKMFLKKEVQLKIYKHRASRLVFNTAHIEERSGSKNRYQMEAIAAARAHVEYQMLMTMHEQVTALDAQYQELAQVLKRLTNLFALSTIVHPSTPSAISFAEDGHLNLSQMRNIRDCVDQLLVELLPDAVALTDAWDFSDASLCSALGCYDGNVYERLFAWMKQLPINLRMAEGNGVLLPEWEHFVQPLLKGAASAKL
jgi:acyl-CoA oxidase